MPASSDPNSQTQSEFRRARARHAIHTRWHPDDHEGRARLAAELREAANELWVEQIVATAPPLTDEQRARLCRIILTGEVS